MLNLILIWDSVGASDFALQASTATSFYDWRGKNGKYLVMAETHI